MIHCPELLIYTIKLKTLFKERITMKPGHETCQISENKVIKQQDQYGGDETFNLR